MKPTLVPIQSIKQENPSVKTFYFDYELKSKPGQFVMLWVPGVDQKPFSISYDTGSQFGVSVFPVGPMSEALCKMKEGDRVGITGPFGNPFAVKPDTHYITVAGGYGAGPLGMLAEQVSALGSTVDFCVGARSEDLLLFEERVTDLPSVTVHAATDDGSRGHKGYVTEVVNDLLEVRNQSEDGMNTVMVAACGPELMEKAVVDLCNTYNAPCQISVERYMKCGFNICGQCTIDPLGIPLCSVGPVLDRDMVNKLTEFGQYHRDTSGKKIDY